jgi:hypothetical protein
MFQKSLSIPFSLLLPACVWAAQSSSSTPAQQAAAPVVSAEPAQVPAVSSPAAVTPTPAQSPADPHTLLVPINTTIPLELRAALSSRTAYVGQAVYCDTVYPIVVKNRVVIPVGSYVKGVVTQVQRPGRVKGKAQLGLRFDEITLPNGTTKSLRAVLSGFGGSGNEGFNAKEGKIQGESSKGKDAEVIAVSGAEGAGIGSVAGISGHHSGVGAGAGGAAGALGGLVYVLTTRGKDVVLPHGTNLELQLAAPLSYYRDEVDSSSTDPGGPALGKRDPGPG